MNRHVAANEIWASPRNIRLFALVLAFVAINQIEEPMIQPTLSQQVLYWSVRLSLLASGLWLTHWWVDRSVAGSRRYPVWLYSVVLVSVVGIVPLSIAEILIEPYLPMRPEFQDDELWAFSPILAWGTEYLTLLSILLPIHLLIWLGLESRATQPEFTSSVEPRPLPSFLQSTSIKCVDQVVALQAEEHYVRIHTADGSELVYCRFGDAVAEMMGSDGLRVHRSWWVRADAVSASKRGARRWQLHVGEALSVPVSDSYVSDVRARGLLKR